MSVCNPNANPPIPAGLASWASSGQPVTPEMQHWAASIANDLSIPIGSIYRKWFGAVPVVGIVLCHSYTVLPDGTQQPGAYHGVTLFYPTDLSLMPPEGGAPKEPPYLDYAFFGLLLFSTVFGVTSALRARGLARRSAAG